MVQARTGSEGRKIPIEPYFGGFILETLTLGMYGEARNAIREYLQNGFDAVRQAVREGLIQPSDAAVNITMSPNKLVIRDNGIGLGSGIAVSTLTSIGASRKDFRSEAGFRGIGRLAGIVFCETLTFVTKAGGEKVETVVMLNAAGLRHDMSPARGGHLPLDELLQKHVQAYQLEGEDEEDHFFEVSLDGFHNPPGECTDPFLMINFVSQVAPVPYADSFSFRNRLLEEAGTRKIAIDQVQVCVIANNESTFVYKPYGAKFPVGKDAVSLEKIEIRESPSKLWWGWTGHKTEPGAYRDENTKAIRVRVRNIQIDGTQIIGGIFEKQIPKATSYGRFNDWFIGEIFVDPGVLVPNARRDGFEDDQNWRTMREELAAMCSDLGAEAYRISHENQHSVRVLGKDTRELELAIKRFDKDAPAVDEIIDISNQANKIQRRLSRAVRYADLEVTSQLRSLENRVLDVKSNAVRKLGVTQMEDIDEIREDAQDEIVAALMKAFKEQLDTRCFGKVRLIVERITGQAD